MFTRLILKIASLLIVISLFSSCTPRGMRISGQYNSKRDYLNSKLFVKDDMSFYYTNDGLLLYVEGENFYYTMGSWTQYKDTLYLNSYLDTIINDTISITDSKTNALKSRFTFFSSEGDTLPFNRVDKNERTLAQIVHSNYKSLEFGVDKGDNLTFWFDYGYSPATIIISNGDNRNYKISLRRKFLRGHFKDTKFLIKRNKLIEIGTNEKYIRVKNGM